MMTKYGLNVHLRDINGKKLKIIEFEQVKDCELLR